MYNRPCFIPWVNAKKFVVQIPLTKDEPAEYDLAPSLEFYVGQDVIFDPGTGESTKKGTIVRKPYKHLRLYDVDFHNGYMPERISCDELKPLSLDETDE